MNKWVLVLSLGVLFGSLPACKTGKEAGAKTAAVAEPVDSVMADETIAEQFTPADSVPEWVKPKGPYQPERTKRHDLLHTRLDIRPDWGQQYLYGTATLTLKPYFYPQQTLELDAKGFEIKSVELSDAKTKQATPLQYTYDSRKLTIQLDRTYTRSEKYTVVIGYVAKPNEGAVGGSAAITSDKGLYFINPDGSDPNKMPQIWTQGETESNSRWFPTIDSPNERCTEEIYLTVDPKYATLSNGKLVYSRTNRDGTKTDYWKQDQPHAPYLFMIAVGEFSVIKDKWRDKELSYYVPPAYAKYAKDIFGRTPEMMEFFSTKLNYPFPWDKYGQVVVEDFVSGAMENTTAVTFYNQVLMDDRELLDDNSDNIIAHELFHHWFGDLVTSESWSNLPLNESFANYSEYLWQEYKNGADEADFHGQNEAEQYFAEAENKQEDLIRFRYQDREDMFDSHSYAKGGRILHMLRKYVGDDAFFTALNLYLNQHKYTDVEVHDLRLAFEEVTGEDLNWFFNQWFLASGHPDLAISHAYENGKLLLRVQQRQDSAYTPICRLPVKVDVWTAGKRTRHDVTVTLADETIELPAAAKPDLVLFDAETQLLGRISHPKSTDERIFQFYNTDRYLSRYEAFNDIFEVVKALEASERDENAASTADKPQSNLADPRMRKLAQDALSDKFWVIRQMGVRNLLKVKGEDRSAFEEKLKNLALSDPRSYVRAEAINTLAEWDSLKYQPIFKQALADKSYSVVSNALHAYLSSSPSDAAQRVAEFSQLGNDDVALTIANYYAEKADPGAYDWFAKQLGRSDNFFVAQAVQFFGQYLTQMPPETQLKGVKLVERIARQGPADEARFYGYMTLGLFAELEGVKEMRQDIKAKETSPKLKQLYEMLP